MTLNNTQGASLLEIGVLTSKSRPERSSLLADAAAGSLFDAIFNEASSEKTKTSANGEAPDDKIAETQSFDPEATPVLYLEGLVLLHVGGMQGANEPSTTMQQPERAPTKAFGVAALIGPAAPNAGSTPSNAWCAALNAGSATPNAGSATSNDADEPKSMTLDAFVTNLPTVVARALSDVGPTKEPDVEVEMRDPSKRLSVVSLATHLPPAQTEIAPIAEEAFASNESDRENGQPSLATAAKNPEKIANPVGHEAFSGHLDVVVDAPTLPIGSPNFAGAISSEGVKTTATSAPRAVMDGQMKNSPSKVLTIQLEPEALGVVTVRMQLTKTRVSLKIDVDSPSVQTMLSQSRDQLAEALGKSGHSIEEIAIRVSPAPVMSASFGDTRPSESQAHNEQSHEGGSLGGNDGAGSNREERSFSHSSRRGERQDDERLSLSRARPTGAPGLYL